MQAALRFRKSEPHLYSVCSDAINRMVQFIKKTGAPEVCAIIKNDKITEVYAND